ncbi:hypothetical protein FRC08_007989 [Ceratobasidium sp. 394]|nr:hypothetical protein FRC08_007989 [Ceratobasidium sp. 394]
MRAARQLRFPFWDWTHRRTETQGFPNFLREPQIDLLMPGGIAAHRNVLAFFEFTPPVDGFSNRLRTNRLFPDPAIAYFREWERTYRHPNSSPVGVNENYNAITTRLTSEGGPGSWVNLTRAVAQMFVFPVDIPCEKRANAWDEFSNTTFQSGHRDFSNPTRINSPHYWRAVSIEQPHNDVHLLVGGLGHMHTSNLVKTGFDPLFFLHHCNIDRLLAFWEHVYPDYVAGTEGFLEADSKCRVPFTQSKGTFIQTNGQVVDSNSPLMPFRKPCYTYWNSRDTHSLQHDPENRSPGNKYYTYPPINGVDLRRPAGTPEERDRQRALLQRYFQYDPYEAIKTCGVSMEQRLFADIAPYAGTTPRPSGRKYVPKFRQFVISVSLEPTYIEASYQLIVQAESNKKFYEVGSVSVLARGQSASCGNCQAQRAAGVRVHGTIFVPHTVIAMVLLFLERHTADTSDESVLQGIKMSLRATLVLPDGKNLSRLSEEVPDDRRLQDGKAPALNLLSSDVYQSETQDSQEEQPFEFDDWTDHGPVEDVEDAEGTEIRRRRWVEVEG